MQQTAEQVLNKIKTELVEIKDKITKLINVFLVTFDSLRRIVSNIL